MTDFPRMSIPYKGDRYTGKSQKVFGQYVYELDRAGELFWTHTMPATAARQGLVPASPAASQSGSEGQQRPIQAAMAHIDTVYPQTIRFADLKKSYKVQFGDLANRLSPENLACDGEISGRQIRTKKSRLLAEWRRLEKEVGFPVSIDDVVNWK